MEWSYNDAPTNHATTIFYLNCVLNDPTTTEPLILVNSMRLASNYHPYDRDTTRVQIHHLPLPHLLIRKKEWMIHDWKMEI